MFSLSLSLSLKTHTSYYSSQCRVLREVTSQDVDIKVNKGKTETVQVAVGGEVFSEYPGTKVYLRFDVVLSVYGTSQIFAEKVPVAPIPPELKIIGPGIIIMLLLFQEYNNIVIQHYKLLIIP